jgi:hypothetical protein
MKNFFNWGLFSPKNKKDENMKTNESVGTNENIAADEIKFFAVVHGGQGRMEIITEATHEKLKNFLYIYCKNPQEMEAMGTCNKNGVIEMTNPDKFNRKWLDAKIRSQLFTFRDIKDMFKGKETK